MELVSAILGQFMGVGFIALIILFQQEIRKFLLFFGRQTIFEREGLFGWRKSSHEQDIDVTPIVEAAKAMSGNKTGALIVISKDSSLDNFAETGDMIDGTLSKRLLTSIFFKNSPMHDGAVIINKGKVIAARCVLPVSEQEDIPAHMGLRHRAAIGMTEITNTLVLVVSEETGQMSIVRNGKIFHNLSAQEIRAKITNYLSDKISNKESAFDKNSSSENMVSKVQSILKEEIKSAEQMNNQQNGSIMND